MYKNLSGMTERTSSGFVSGGVATQDAAAHPEWFLLNTSGQRFTSRYFGWVWIADVGSASYQQQWADNVLGEIAAGGWDGVFMDDTNPTMSWHYDVNRIAKYPTDAAWQAATRSALVSIGSRFRSAGKLVIPNFSNQKSFPAVIKDWMGLVDGGLNEQFLKWGTTQTGPETYDPTDYWELQLRADEGGRGGGQVLPRHHALDGDRPRRRPLRLRHDAAGRRRASCSSRCTTTTRTSAGSRSTTTRSATPPAPSPRTRAAIHNRVFANGLVYVNPTVQRRARRLRRRLHRLRPGRTRPRPPCSHEAAWCWQRQVKARPFRPPRPARTDRTKKQGDGGDVPQDGGPTPTPTSRAKATGPTPTAEGPQPQAPVAPVGPKLTPVTAAGHRPTAPSRCRHASRASCAAAARARSQLLQRRRDGRHAQRQAALRADQEALDQRRARRRRSRAPSACGSRRRAASARRCDVELEQALRGAAARSARRAVARPASMRSRRDRRVVESSSIARASAAGSRGGTSASAGRRVLGDAADSEATAGMPAAIASSSASGLFSMIEGSTKTDSRLQRLRARDVAGELDVGSPAARSRSAASCEPVPKITKRAARGGASRSIRYSRPLTGSSSATSRRRSPRGSGVCGHVDPVRHDDQLADVVADPLGEQPRHRVRGRDEHVGEAPQPAVEAAVGDARLQARRRVGEERLRQPVQRVHAQRARPRGSTRTHSPLRRSCVWTTSAPRRKRCTRTAPTGSNGRTSGSTATRAPAASKRAATRSSTATARTSAPSADEVARQQHARARAARRGRST